MKIKSFFKELLQKPFVVSAFQDNAHAKFTIEGATVVLHRAGIRYLAPAVADTIVLQTGVKITLKKGYCAIMHFPDTYKNTGLVPVVPVQVINHGHISEIEIPCYISWNPHFSESSKVYEPFALGEPIAFLTIVKTAKYVK